MDRKISRFCPKSGDFGFRYLTRFACTLFSNSTEFIRDSSLQVWNVVEGWFSNPLFSIFLIPTISLHGNTGVAHALIVEVRNKVC